MSRSVVGLDLGSASIKVARVRTHPQSGLLEVEYCEERALPAAPEGAPKEESLRQRQAQVVRQLHDQGLLRGDELVSSLGNIHAHTRTIPLPFTDGRKIEAVLKSELESYLPIAIDDLVLSWVLQPPELFKQTSHKQTQHPVAVAFARRDALQQHLELLKQLQLDPRCTTLQPAALAGLYQILRPAFPLCATPADDSNEQGDGSQSLTEEMDPRVGGDDKKEGDDPQGVGEQDASGSRGAPQSMEQSENFVGESRAPIKNLDPKHASQQDHQVTLMVDMGHTSTKMCALQDTHILSTRCILRGGRDASLCLAKLQKLPLEQAQLDKHEGEKLTPQAIETVLQEAYGPIAREIHQTVLALQRQWGKTVQTVIVTGGASRMVGLQDFFTKRLDVPIHLLVCATDASLPQPQFATAVGQAAYALHEATRTTQFNFRKGEFAWRGEFVYLHERARPLTAWCAVLVGMLFTYSTSQAFIHRKEISDLQKQRDALCKQVLRKGFTSGDKCLKQMQKTIDSAQTHAIPQTSAADVYLELAKAIPAQISVQFTKLDVTEQTVRLDAVSKSFEDIDQIVTALSQRTPFAKVERGRAAQAQEGVRFQLKISLISASSSAQSGTKTKRTGSLTSTARKKRSQAKP